MKKIFFTLLALVFTVYACKKASTAPPSNPVNPSNPSVTKTAYYDLKYWINDTLIKSAFPPALPDTMYALTVGGKNYIIYKGIQYPFKVYITTGETFSDSTGSYFYDLFDMAGNFITSKDSINVACQVYTSRSYDKAYNTWNKHKQIFYPPHKPPFPQDAVAFISINLK